MTRLILFPGAGSDSNHSSLVAIERAVKPIKVVRADFPYRKAGKKAPDRSPILEQAVRDEVDRVRRGPVVLGGRSMGGRICSMVVGDAVDPVPAAGLVLISYPLHPPGKPERLRVEHFPRIHVPCLFVHGTNDRFGSPDELREWTATIPGPVTFEWIEGKGHDLKGADDRIASVVAEWIDGL